MANRDTPANGITISRWANPPLLFRNVSGKRHPDFETIRHSLRDSFGHQRAALVNEFKTLHPLPPELKDLLLHPELDGLNTVNSPGFNANHTKYSITPLLENQITNPASKNTRGSSYLPPTINATNKLDIPLCFSLSHIPIATPLLQLQPSPGTLFQEEYVCNEVSSTCQSPFKTR